MEDHQIPGGSGNQNRGLSVQVPDPLELCFRVCTTPLSELTRSSVCELRVGEPANGFYLLLRTLEPTVKGAIDFEFGPNLLVQVEDHDKNRVHLCLHAHVHLRSETELEDLLPVNTVFVFKEPVLVACPEEQFAVVVGSPSDFVLVGRGHVLYKDTVALDWRPKLEDDGTDHSALSWKAKGDALFERGKFDEALDVYLFAQTIGGDNVTNLLIDQNLAQVCYKLGHLERAIKHCLKILESVPTNQTALYLLGLAHYELKQFTEAKMYFERLRDVSPSNGLAEAELVRCDERLREMEGHVDILKLLKDCQNDTTTPIDHGNFSRNIKVPEGPDNERGVYATEDMVPGTMILVEKPIVVVFEPESSSESGYVDLMRTALRAVTKNPKSVGQKLYGLPGGCTQTEDEKRIFCDEVNELEPIVDVKRLYQPIKRSILKIKNCMVQNGQMAYVVYEMASRIRHCCLSNCTFICYKDAMAVRTCTAVSKGDELNVSFIRNSLTFREKQAVFVRIGYACGCRLCDLDQMETDEVLVLRDELKDMFYMELNLYGRARDVAERYLLPTLRQLEQTYSDTNALRPFLFLAYCDLAKIADRNREDSTRAVTSYVETGLRSGNLSIEFLLSLVDEVNPQFPQWVSMPETLFEYAAIMVNLETCTRRPDHADKWMKVLLVLESLYSGGSVEMLKFRYPGFTLVQSTLSARAQTDAQRCPTGSHLG